MMHPVINKNQKQVLTSMQLRTQHVELNILHIGRISNALYTFFETVNMAFNPVQCRENDINFDIVLVNNDCQTNTTISNPANDTDLKVAYTKNRSFIDSRVDFIDLSLVPILLRYLVKIKTTYKYLKNTRKATHANSFLKQVDEVINDHIDDHSLNMERLSHLVGMSRSTFSKRIKAYTGLKPTEYVNAYRLEKSKQFLIITNWQLSRISDVLGFSSQQYYCRLFKKKEGVSPSQFRTIHKNPIV